MTEDEDAFAGLRRSNEKKHETSTRAEEPQRGRVTKLPVWKSLLFFVVSFARDFVENNFPKAENVPHSDSFLSYYERRYDQRNLTGYDEDGEEVDVPPPPPLRKVQEYRIWKQKYGDYTLSQKDSLLRRPPKAYEVKSQKPIIIAGRRIGKGGLLVGILLLGCAVTLTSTVIQGIQIIF